MPFWKSCKRLAYPPNPYPFFHKKTAAQGIPAKKCAPYDGPTWSKVCTRPPYPQPLPEKTPNPTARQPDLHPSG
jgi:hypothetical protein